MRVRSKQEQRVRLEPLPVIHSKLLKFNTCVPVMLKWNGSQIRHVRCTINVHMTKMDGPGGQLFRNADQRNPRRLSHLHVYCKFERLNN